MARESEKRAKTNESWQNLTRNSRVDTYRFYSMINHLLLPQYAFHVIFMSPHVWWWLHPLWWIHIFFYWSWICKQVQTCENRVQCLMLREMREIHRGPTLWGIHHFGHFDGCKFLCIRSCFFGILPQEWGYQQRRSLCSFQGIVQSVILGQYDIWAVISSPWFLAAIVRHEQLPSHTPGLFHKPF